MIVSDTCGDHPKSSKIGYDKTSTLAHAEVSTHFHVHISASSHASTCFHNQINLDV